MLAKDVTARTTGDADARALDACDAGVMAVLAQPRPKVAVASLPDPRLLETRRRAAKLHLLTYVVGSALFWILWAAISVTADRWYWWLVVPFVAWTIVLVIHLWRVYR
jgi:hypothetical protein